MCHIASSPRAFCRWSLRFYELALARVGDGSPLEARSAALREQPRGE